MRCIASSLNPACTQVLEREDTVAAGASSGNSGLGCTGYDAPKGSLESRLLRRSIRLHQNLYRSFGLSRQHVNKCGALVVAWTPEELSRLQGVLEDNIAAGDTDVELLSREELRELEPSLSRNALGAVLLPHEAVVEPWLVPMCYAESARRHGVYICTGINVVDVTFDNDSKLWSVFAHNCGDTSVGRSRPGELLVRKLTEENSAAALQAREECCPRAALQEHKARVVINCAGLFGDTVERMRKHALGGSNSAEIRSVDDFRITPRKGQFVVFDPESDPHGLGDACIAPQHIIEPVASQFTKGVIVWTTVYGNVIVGPTAVDQEDKTDRSTDEQTIARLRSYGESVIPSLKYATVVGSYSGLRPSTQYRDYQISAFADHQWITVGGIRSTGLSAASGIGEYVGELYREITAGKGCGRDRVTAIPDAQTPVLGVTASALDPLPVQQQSSLKTSPPMTVPTLSQLSEDYICSALNSHNVNLLSANTVELFGRQCRVTHPISSFGMETFKKQYNE